MLRLCATPALAVALFPHQAEKAPARLSKLV